MDESIYAVHGRQTHGIVQRFVHLAARCGTCSRWRGWSPAQAAEATDEGAPSLQEVTVTGSRIRLQTGMNTPVPVTTLAPSDLAALNPGASIGDQLDRLAQLFQTESAPAQQRRAVR